MKAGNHNNEIYESILVYEKEQIAELDEKGVIYAGLTLFELGKSGSNSINESTLRRWVFI